MDILCIRCGENWDRMALTDEFTPEETARFRKGEGCPSCYGKDVETPANAFECEAQAAMAEVLGDDLDGLASMMDDFGLV